MNLRSSRMCGGIMLGSEVWVRLRAHSSHFRPYATSRVCISMHVRAYALPMSGDARSMCARVVSAYSALHASVSIPMASGSAFLFGDCIPSSRRARVSAGGGKPKRSRSSRILSQNSSRIIEQSTRCSIFSISEHVAHFPSVSLSCFL